MATETTKDNIEAAKVVGRNGVLAAFSALLAALTNWLLTAVFSISVPLDVTVGLAGVLYAISLYVDKKIHESRSKLTGLVPF